MHRGSIMRKRSITIGLTACLAIGIVAIVAADHTSHASDRVDGVIYWPSYHRYQQLVRSALTDPDSAKFEALSFRRTPQHLYLCGRVNARNRMGGYTGFTWFAASEGDGVLIASDGDNKLEELKAVLDRCGG